MIKSLTVLGGGNAGLMSALYLKTSVPDVKFTIIKSSKIGTIGVGEGSTEHWVYFAKVVGISFVDLVKECGATFKMGLKFENWHGDGTSYFHSLPTAFTHQDPLTGVAHQMMGLIANGTSTQDLNWNLPMEGYVAEPFENVFQFHFDSEKLNAFLIKKSIEAGINIIEADIVNTNVDNEGFVESIVDTNGNVHFADFFIDSSGFNRVIASNVGAGWVDWSHYLPLNSVIAFQTPYQEELPPYTLARCMNAGWMWRAPVQERFGNGYVYDDRFITEEEALTEVQQYFDFPLKVGRKIKYKSGHVNKAWIKNVVSIGLSSNFVEPLEASSISTTIQQSRLLATALWNWTREDTASPDKYNEVVDNMMHNILDFIQLHYYTQREDTEFWRWVKNELPRTEFIKNNLENFKTNFVNQLLLPEDGAADNYMIYDCLNWIQVMHGLRMFDVDSIKELYNRRCKQFYSKLDAEQLSYLPNEPTADYWFTCRDAINIINNELKVQL
jgi:tryptophan halogenase